MNSITKKTNPSSYNTYTVKLWSMDHYDKKINANSNVFAGVVISNATKKLEPFHNLAGLATLIEKDYRKIEKQKKQ